MAFDLRSPELKGGELWRVRVDAQQKASQVRRLAAELVVRHEYRHASFPHPSSYAYLELT